MAEVIDLTQIRKDRTQDTPPREATGLRPVTGNATVTSFATARKKQKTPEPA